MSEHRLNEILIERPRVGMRIPSTSIKGFKKSLHKLTVEASEDGLLSPYIIKVRNRSKYLTDHLGPLRRFLMSKVGEPWNEVYSELCERLDTNTMTGQHVLSHLRSFVEEDVEIIDGLPYRKPHQMYRSPLSGYRDDFYVHPETGILCLAEKIPRKQKRQQTNPDAVIIDNYHQYHKINEVWYLVTFADFPPPPTQYVNDVIKGLIGRDRAMYVRGRWVYAVSKQQCNKKEIRFILTQLVKQK